MKVKINGRWSKNRTVRAHSVGYPAEGIKLNGSDLKELSHMSDGYLAQTIRNISARVNRFPEGTRTGRHRPEMQFLGKSQMPRDREKSVLIATDFSELEKRAMAIMGATYPWSESYRDFKESVTGLFETDIDEEGCGAVFAAIKEHECTR